MTGSGNDSPQDAAICVEKLLNALDLAAAEFQFPGWECGEQNAVVGAMRAFGFTFPSGAALLFEQFGYSIKEDVLQSLAFCFATSPVAAWISPGEGPIVNLRPNDQGELWLPFGEIEIVSRGRTFVVPFSKSELISEGYIDADASAPTPEALLFRICDVVPREWLFSRPEHLKRVFLDEQSRFRFAIDSWRHPSFDDLYGDAERRPSGEPDICAMAEAICRNRQSVELTEVPNTSWRDQCGRKKS